MVTRAASSRGSARATSTPGAARRQRQRLAAGFSRSCVRRRWRPSWRSWVSCARSHGPGCPMTTHQYFDSLLRTAKYRPDYPRRPLASTEEAYLRVASFVGWYNNRHRQSGIKFVTPHQPHSGQMVKIIRQHAVLYEHARERLPRC
jgi:hypothetical protein